MENPAKFFSILTYLTFLHFYIRVKRIQIEAITVTTYLLQISQNNLLVRLPTKLNNCMTTCLLSRT